MKKTKVQRAQKGPGGEALAAWEVRRAVLPEKGRFEYVPVSQIEPASDSARKINPEDSGFIELVESVRAGGVRVPVIMREHPAMSGRYELRFGHRRLAASIAAGRECIPAVIIDGLDDAAAADVTYIENKYRRGLLPLEESAAACSMLEKYGGDARAAASRLGMPVFRLRQLAAIEKGLSAKWRKEVEKSGEREQLTAAHLAVIAAQPAAVQDGLLACPWKMNDCVSVGDFEKLFENEHRRLDSAPWDLTDTGLVKKAGACLVCPDRSSARPGLFDDDEDAEASVKNDLCLNPACWQAKMAEFIDRKFRELKAEKPGLRACLPPDCRYSQSEFLSNIREKYGPVEGDWKKAKAGDKGAVEVFMIYGPKAGEVMWVRPFQQQTGGGGRRTKRSEAPLHGTEKGVEKTLDEKREALEKKRWSFIVNKVSSAVAAAGLERLLCDDKLVTVAALAATFGTTDDYLRRAAPFGDSAKRSAGWKVFAKLEDKKDDAAAALWAVTRTTLSGIIAWSGPVTQVPDGRIEAARAVCRLLGIEVDTLMAEASAEYPEPRSWKREA